MNFSLFRLFALCGILLSTLLPAAAPQAFDLRVDGRTEPLGVDSDRTYLSWKLASDKAGAAQAAWEVRAASTPARLEAGDADLWSTGRREGAEQLMVRYRGARPEGGKAVFWQVRVWNAAGEVSPWSEVASWTAGLRPSDWKASWIAHPDWLKHNRAHLGYRSLPAENVDTPKWLELDLGEIRLIDGVRLRAIRHTIAERTGFPTRFVLQIATRPDFSDATVVADSTGEPRNIWMASHAFTFEPTKARYVRLEVPELRSVNGEICLALSQIEVYADGTNVAPGAVVSASDSIEEGLYAAAAVVDGKGVPGTNPVENKTVVLRRDFEVEGALARAVLFVTGLGGYTAELNGEAIGEQRLSPGWSDAEKRVFYDTFDVTRQLREGANAIGLTLASSMYSVSDPAGRYTKLVGRFRPLQAIAQLRLDYTDGSTEWIVSDGKWKTAEGPTTYSHVFGGEDLDARRISGGWSRPGFEDQAWQHVTTTAGPGGRLLGASYAAPAIVNVETLSPVSVNTLSPGKAVYDLGQNASIMPALRARGERGSRVRLTPAELLHADGTVDRLSSGHNNPAYWELTLAGTGEDEAWIPSFFYHGARYLQVETFPAEGDDAMPEVVELTAQVTHSSATPVGRFASSSELFNRIHNLIRWAQRSNIVSLVTDCPHRERLGWLEQMHLHGPSLRYEFDLGPLFQKAFGDMADAQTAEGLVPNIAPEFVAFEGDFRDSPEWGSALIIGAWQQYIYYGDDRAFHEFYNPMQNYFEYLASKADGHILDHGLGDWYDIGPEHPGFSQLTPVALPATAIYYEDARIMAKIAAHRTRWGEAAAYEERAEHIRTAFNKKFFDPATGSYATGSQTANAMPLALGMVPEGREQDVLEALLADIRAKGDQVTSGDVGHRYLLRALADYGRSDVIFDLHHQSDRPGYGWQLEQGATSLTEAWNASRRASQNHFMLGHLMEWFYHDLGGIAPDPAAPGFARVVIAPQPVGDLTWAEVTYDSVRGPIHVRWEREDDRFRLRCTLPANVAGTVRLPDGTENEVGAGTHHFETEDPL